MITFYVKLDPDTGYVTAAPQTEAADGLTEVYLLQDSVPTFTKQWAHYYRADNGVMKPDQVGMMDMSYDFLVHQNEQLQASWVQSYKALTAAQTDVAKAKADAADAQSKLATTTQTLIQLQQMAVQSSQAQAQSASSNSEMKTMLVQITQAMATLQAGNTKTTE